MKAVGLHVGEHPAAHPGSRDWLALSQASAPLAAGVGKDPEFSVN